MSKQVSPTERITKEKEYIAFLEKRVASENFKRNESPAIVKMTQDKLKKARLVLRLLEKGN